MHDGPAAWKGLSDVAPVFIGYERVERMIEALLDGVAAWRPNSVAGLMRGGLVPATMVACGLGLDLSMVALDRATQGVSWLGQRPRRGRVLLVDDSCSTGATLRLASAALRAQNYDCSTLTIAHDPETTAFVPDFSHPVRALFRLPWERGEATPAARAARAAGRGVARALEAPFIGLDIDGSFADAMDPTAPLLPPFDVERAVVVTARPASDRSLLEAWLARAGAGAVRVECRPDHVASDAASLAQFKADAATRLGCTHFVAGDAEQALRIAALAPHLVVSWWSADEARAWIVAADAQPPGAAQTQTIR